MTPPDSDDLTRKQRREQARSERKALEEAEAARAVRRKRLTQLGGVIGAVVVVIVVIVLATGGGKGAKPIATTNLSAHSQEISTVSGLLKGIPQSGNILGNPNAAATMVYFGDLECPICKDFTLGALPTIIERYVRPGKLKIEYRSLSTATGGAESGGSEPQGTFSSQQVAALAAGKQNLMWNYLELFYHEQGEEATGYVTESYLQGLAQQVAGLKLPQWTAARGDAALEGTIQSDAQAANQLGFSGTPSFQLGKKGGSLQTFSPSSFSEASAYTPTLDKLVS